MGCLSQYQGIIQIVFQVLQSVGIIIALYVSFRAFGLSKKDLEARLRPYVFAHGFDVTNVYPQGKSASIENLSEFYIEVVLKNSGQSPAIIEDPKFEETVSGQAPRTSSPLKEQQIIYPDSNVVNRLPPIKGELAKKIAKGEANYEVEISITYYQVGIPDKKYQFERTVAYNHLLEAKIQNKSIGKVT